MTSDEQTSEAPAGQPPATAPAAAAVDLHPAVVDLLHPGYVLRAGVPPVAAYRHLRSAAGLTPVTEAQAARVAGGSWYGCYVVHASTGEAVAMGRIIGDGGWYFHVADMATLPDHQRKGLGSAILRNLLSYINENAPKDGKPLINLFADPPGRKLYKNLGFVEYSMVTDMGMVLHAGPGSYVDR